MTTWTAFTTLPNGARAEALGAALEAMTPAPDGVGVFELEDGTGVWEVGAYFTAAPDGVALAVLAAAFEAKDFCVSELPETDWVASVQRALHPVEAGRFFVYGSHDADRVPEGRIALLIDASMAFGTGHHGTTQGCLTALDALADWSPRRIADIGCGTGVLAMAAARLWPMAEDVHAADIDPVAVEVASANVKANDLADRIVCLQASGFDDEMLRAVPYDLVFANILKAPLLALSSDLATAVVSGGRAILSGLLREQGGEVREVYECLGFDHEVAHPIGEWTTLTLRRR